MKNRRVFNDSFLKKFGIQKGDSPNAIKTIFSTIITLGKWWEGKRGRRKGERNPYVYKTVSWKNNKYENSHDNSK